MNKRPVKRPFFISKGGLSMKDKFDKISSDAQKAEEEALELEKESEKAFKEGRLNKAIALQLRAERRRCRYG